MILSLDCSTHSTGWALFKDKELVDYGCITSQKSNVFENIFTIIAGIDKVLEKYPDIVTVYSIGEVSKELCGGPHVKNTSELGHFKITKEEASSAGVRRIKAVLTNEQYI